MSGRDFYAILGVKRDANEDELKKAYKKAAIKWHPDKHASKSAKERSVAEEKFKEVAEAFEVLSDKDKRAVYDRYGEQGLKAGGGNGGGQPGAMPGGGGGAMPGFSGFPGGVHFSFSSNGGAPQGMDAARAQQLFQQMFGEMGGMGGGMGGMGGFGEMSAFGDLADSEFSMGMGGPRTRSGMRRQRAGRPQVDRLAPGTVVRLVGLSNPTHNGSIGHVESYDVQTRRYVVVPEGGRASIAVKPSNVTQVVTSARVAGTSQPALNDKLISAATFDRGSKRYKCEGLKPDGTILALKPNNVILPKDCRVTIEDVRSRPELNGQVGSIVGVEQERYVVRTPQETVKLRFGAVAAA